MTRYAISRLIFVLFATPSFAFAAGTTTQATSTPLATTTPAIESSVSVKKSTDTTPKAAKEKISDARKAKIEEYAKKATERLSLVADKQGELITKIESRIRKYGERNFDTSAQEEKLLAAEASLEEAKTSVAGISDAVDTAIETGSADQALTVALETVRDAQDTLSISHEKISNLIDSLQDLADSKPLPQSGRDATQ